jgi:hypothetical protein
MLLRLLLEPLSRVEGEMGDELRWWWELWVRAARLVRGAGVALALLAAGGWAIHRWFPTAREELDAVPIALAIMILWEAGGFVVMVSRLRDPYERPIRDLLTGAATAGEEG